MASRSLTDLNALLAEEYKAAKDEFYRLYPGLPQPFVTCTYRSKDEQTALYAQSRESLQLVNGLRKKAGLAPISMEENKKKVTNARAGQSPHNFHPALAFDIAFITINNKLDWSDHLFAKFAKIICANPLIEWGGHFRSLKDAPHYQLRNWSAQTVPALVANAVVR